VTETLDLDVNQAGRERQRDVAMGIQRRLVDHIRQGTTDRVEGPMQNSGAAYSARHWHDAEQERVFRTLPLLACLSADMPEPGDKTLFEAAGPPILIVRTRDGSVRAYLNMCTHRAAKLVTACTASKRMTCGFHGWTFDLEGNLIGMPGSDKFEGLERESFKLISVPCQEWKGLIFVIAKPGEPDAIDVEGHLGTFAPELAQMDFARATPVKTSRVDVEANWKYALDTYGEGYHFSTLHPKTIGMTAHNDMMVIDTFDRHHRINFPYKDQNEYMDRPEQEWPRRPYGGIHLLFPNTIINISSMGPGQVFGVYRMFPDGGPDRAYTLMATYRSGTVASDVDRQPWINFHDFIENVVRTEDYSVSATGQANLRYAPADFKVTYGSNEGTLQHFHRHIADLIGRNDLGSGEEARP
jgi:phenylpropionate dioxygenase-like ring-hydroxylating dioxygenase large terminal subunit